jgi:hypothetical protein
MNWIQYLDQDGKLSTNLSIDQFPTNFLLDNSWKIISKNIEPDQLDLFLKGNCNKNVEVVVGTFHQVIHFHKTAAKESGVDKKVNIG